MFLTSVKTSKASAREKDRPDVPIIPAAKLAAAASRAALRGLRSGGGGPTVFGGKDMSVRPLRIVAVLQ